MGVIERNNGCLNAVLIEGEISKDDLNASFIKDEIDKNPIIYSDKILIEKINGDKNTSVFKRAVIKKLCKKINQSAYQVCMRFMIAQNKKIKN